MAEKGHGGEYRSPERTPYASLDRLTQPKETFKRALALMAPLMQGRRGALLDLGCANGEFIHYLDNNLPGWTFTGIDITPAFIEVARGIKLPNATFAVGNLMTASGQFDVVTCIGTLPMFEDIESALARMLDLCVPGGLVLADGFFNAANMDVRIEYRENQGDESDPWHIGFNHFSQARIAKYLKARNLDFQFHDVPFNADLPRDPNKSPVSAWSFRDEAGKRLLTNGLGILVNTTMLLIKKPT